MNKLRNKKNIFKGIVWVFIGLFFCTLISIPKVQPKAELVNNSLEILEIEPGNQFLLGDANKSVEVNADFTPQETIDGSIVDPSLSGKKIGITHVTMQQFISQVDQINGKYDVVVIGRKNSGLRKGHNNPVYTELNSYIYGDYTNPFSETSKKTNLIDEGYIPEGFGWKNIKNGDYLVGNNLALNKTATASSVKSGTGNTAAMAFDANDGTRWESDYQDNQWIYVDLGSNCNLTGVKLKWETAAGKNYKIQVSTDKVNWTDAYTKINGTGGTEDIGFDTSVTGRYVRMYGTKRTTQWGYSLWGFEVYGTEKNSYYEYYSENDITKKRAKEIISLIDSGQPVYIDNKIFDGSLDKTNLVNQFTSKINNKNCWKFTSDEKGILTEENFGDPSAKGMSLLKKIILNSLKSVASGEAANIPSNSGNAGTLSNFSIDEKNKKPILSVQGPEGDPSGSVGNIKNRKMKFNINVSDNVVVGEKLKLNLYLDLSGDTIFGDKELYYQEDITINNETSNYKNITYNMSKDFIGYLDWKVEIVRTLKDENGNNLKNANGDNIEVKSYKIGNLILNPLQGQASKVVKVLQIYPDKNNLDLTTKDILPKVNGYDIQVTKTTVKDFNETIDKNYTDNAKLDDKDKKSVLNGHYNMVIVGFYDMYNITSQSSDFTERAVEEIKKFIATGQSVMFTHDTMPITIRNDSSVWNGSRMLGQKLRDSIGQARYLDENNTNQKDIYSEYKVTKDENGFISGGEYVERTIPHDAITPKNSYTPTYSYGYASDILTGCGEKANGGTSFYSSSNQVYKLNQGLINQYPFKLDDIQVATTHHQWYQLNLEDPDVVPWYTIKLNTQTDTNAWKNQYLDKYDGRNNYYTYSKGNITYSGTGHSGISTTQQNELELFVNTMIKAERGGNHSPEIITSIPKENIDSAINEIAAGEDYIFTLDSNDLDKDLVYVNVTIDGQELTEENVDMGKLQINDENDKLQYLVDTRNNTRKALSIKVPGEDLPKDKETTIRIEAEDVQGAKIEKIYKLKAIPAPQFNVTADFMDITKVDNNDQPIASDVNENTIKVTTDDIARVRYKINPGQLTYGDAEDYIPKDVAIIIDKSINSQVMTSISNGLDKSIFNNNNFVKTENGNVRFDLITYGNGTVYPHKQDIIDSESKDSNGVPINYRNELNNRLLNISTDNLDANNLEGAINVAQNDFFDDPERENSSKTIIIIAGGNPSGDINAVASIAKENNYNIITLAVTNDFNVVNPYEQLLNWHNQMGGLSNDYYISKPDSDGQSTHKNISNNIMPKISETLSLMKYRTYTVESPTLNFNLGENIDLVGNGLTKQDNEDEESKKYIRNIPAIKYMATKQTDGSLVYRGYFFESQVNGQNQEYIADFKIKANETASGSCTFGEPNKITYKSVISQPMENIIQKTPILILNTVLVDHGVYKGLKDGKAEYESNYNFVDDSVVTFAANINDLYKDKSKISLSIDTKSNPSDLNFEIIEAPTIYKYNSSSKRLEKYLEFTKLNDKTYEINDFNGITNNNVIVLYSVKLKGFDEVNKSYEYKNTITADGHFADISVFRKIEDKLPDLF